MEAIEYETKRNENGFRVAKYKMPTVLNFALIGCLNVMQLNVCK